MKPLAAFALFSYCLLNSTTLCAFDWLCEEEASQREGNVIQACGIGQAATEADARDQALENAKREFDKVCKASDDCKGRPVKADPRRTSCKPGAKGVTCHRLVNFDFSPTGEAKADSVVSNGGAEIEEVKARSLTEGEGVIARYEGKVENAFVFVEFFKDQMFRAGVKVHAKKSFLVQGTIGRYEVQKSRVRLTPLQTTCPYLATLYKKAAPIIAGEIGDASIGLARGKASITLAKRKPASEEGSTLIEWGCFDEKTHKFTAGEWLTIQ